MGAVSFTKNFICSFQEGSSHDRGLYLRSFEELFDLSNSDTTSTAHFNFYFTACELYNDQVPLISTNMFALIFLCY
jgi:hypothetical protein